MVELYFNKELSDITFGIDELDEWKRICEETGMTGQLELTKGKSTPIPYPYINEVMERVYSTLCPQKTEYKSFKAVTIPLDVLRQISFSLKESHFQKIEVWADNKKPDPVVVGYHGYYYAYETKAYNKVKNDSGEVIKVYNKQEADDIFKSLGYTDIRFEEEGKYLIARFGDELKPFDQLKKLATERFIEDIGGELKKEIALRTEKLKCLTENTVSYFNGNMSKYDVTNSWN